MLLILAALVLFVIAQSQDESSSDGGRQSTSSSAQKSSGSEFQRLLEQHGLSGVYYEPSFSEDEILNSYLLYHSDWDVPTVEVVDMIHPSGSDTVNYVRNTFYYLLGKQNYTDEQGVVFAESILADFQSYYTSDYTMVNCRYDPYTKICRASVAYIALDNTLVQNELTTSGILDCTGGISYDLSDQDFLDGGYIKK